MNPCTVQDVSRNDWLKLLASLQALIPLDSKGELTGLVTSFAEISSSFSSDDELRLDWLVHAGGVIRARLDRLSTQRLILGMAPDPVVSFEVQTWLDARPKLRDTVFATRKETREAWTEVVPAFRNRPWVEWYPGQDESESFEPPWLLSNDFVGRLRQEGVRSDERVAIESRMAFLRCALSPQDEASETQSLETNAVMVNPTFETVRGTKLMALARRFDEVSHRELTPLEASILDHVRESFRADKMSAVIAVASETNVRREFVLATLEGLILDGFLLGKIAHAANETLQ